MSTKPDIHLKRAYEAPAPDDGVRVLVERLWPRGLSKDKAAIDHWLKDVAPSPDLRRWFNHIPERWDGFVERYRAELAANSTALDELRDLVRHGRVTFVYAARDPEHNSALVLRDVLSKQK